METMELVNNIEQLATRPKKRIVWKENSLDSIPIILNIQEDFIIDQTISEHRHAFNIVETLLPSVTKLAECAFIHQEKSAWDEIQKILYLWNIQDIHRVNGAVSKHYRSIVQDILRNKIIEIELQAVDTPILESKNNFTPKRAVAELAERANSHRINHHPLLNELNQNGLPHEAIKTFASNYYVNNRLFHLFIVTLGLFTPLERRTELANNFYDELGGGDSQMAHPLLFLKNFNTIGRPQEIEPFPESFHLANAKLYAAYLSGNYHYGMGGFGCIELTMPDQMRKILNGFQLSKLPRKDLEFWEIHISIDVEHGKTWFNEMLHLLKTPEEAQDCLSGGMALLEARAKMYDGIWNHICHRREL